MPIKVNVVSNNSGIVVKNCNSNDNIKIQDSSGDTRRLDILIKQLQETKEDIGFVYLDDYIVSGELSGSLPPSVLNLLISYLINKVAFGGNTYYLTKLEENRLVYICSKPGVSPNRVDIKKNTGRFDFSTISIDHSNLSNLDYLHSGHTGFAGIEFGTTEYWNSQPEYVPVSGMLVVYTDYSSYVDSQTGETIYIPAIKIGDGNAHLIDKAFVGGDVLHALEEHVNNTVIHVTQADRDRWDNKLNYNNPQDTDLLEFTRN